MSGPSGCRCGPDLDDGYLELSGSCATSTCTRCARRPAARTSTSAGRDRTATFMILGDRCTRACGFCHVDTRKPLPVDADEPARVADAVATLGLAHAVITCVARDDLPDGGAAVFAATIDAVRAGTPTTTVEVLISDCKGDADALDAIFAARPDVLNHNLETVARLQRAARPSAGYARSLARARARQGRGARHEVGDHPRHGRDRRRGARRDRRPARRRRRHPDARPVPAAVGRPPPGRALVDARRVRRARRLRPIASASPTSSPGPLVRSSYHAQQARTRSPLVPA